MNSLLTIFAQMKHFFVTLLMIAFGSLGASAQSQVAVYDYERFSKWLTKSNDTTYVINFWATWCAPCVKELPDFEQLNLQYRDEKFKMILVSLDFLSNLENRVIPFITQHKLQAEVIMLHEPDGNKWIPQVDDAWSGAIPATVIYNREKDFRSFHEGSYTYDELNSIVKQILNKPL
jgi:thiol-disulfide isomerase/thioredoxin